MGFTTIVGNVFKAVTGPLGILEEWATEPLKRWESEREQANRDREVERVIRQQTGVETVESVLRRQEAEHNASLEIRMQTEIARINAETEQWTKDQEFQRMKDVAEAVTQFRERLTELQLNTIRAIGNMDIELRAKAQDLILAKTREYKALQDQALKDAEAEFERTLEKFSGRGSVYFEYNIPRMGRRADVIVLVDDIVFVLEYKTAGQKFHHEAVVQVWDYALDLKN